ncbi:MAG TPA: peptide chain release factor N(5)-glutamine methyltransferase, partial [Blastocatellia bacterium]|nr:peptide chain release factor N(5)-glutamine methyltransferase [Blastocatellia bacterium]
CDVLGCDQARLVAHNRDEIAAEDRDRYLAAIRRRALGEPLQYIVGRREFYGLDFMVTPDVLIPRPETEFLVEEVIATATINWPDCPLVIADIGTGSGCIAVSVATRIPRALLIATDVSPAALAVARSNATRHGVESRIEFLEGDLLAPLDGRSSVDIIVSNPPYVPDRSLAALQREVRDYEPHVALSGGPDGLGFYRRLLSEAGERLNTPRFLLLEIGFSQLDDVARLGQDASWDLANVTRDLQGIPRALTFQRSRTV